MNTLKMEEMNWLDIQKKLESGFDIVIIPIASIEQHGPHLPLNTDELLGESIAEMTAQKLKNALVAPAIRPGCSEHHLQFPGSLSITEELMSHIICEYCKCYSLYGFKVIVLLPSHGGNFEPVGRIGARLEKEYKLKNIRVIVLSDLAKLVRFTCEALKPFGLTPEQTGWHAGAAETTAVMALRPELVMEDRFEKGYTGSEPELLQLMSQGMKAVTENGVLGDPRGSTAEMGRRLLDYVTDKYAEMIIKAL